MFKIENGTLSMDNHDLDHVQDWEDEYGILGSLENELEMAGLNIKDVQDIQLQGNQMKDKRYCDIYAKIVCAFWNKK